MALQGLATYGEGVGLSKTRFQWCRTSINKTINIKQQFTFFPFKYISL
jgi:hypothetical protein